MISQAVTNAYATLLDKVQVKAFSELDDLMTALRGSDPKVITEALMDLLPLLGDKYVGAGSLLSAEFFDELMAMQEVPSPVPAQTITKLPVDRWHALAGWATTDFDERTAWSRLAGGLSLSISQTGGADTMIGNAEMQKQTLRAQRVPRANCCAFCGMLASRGAVYSAESAGKVVGRGKPVESNYRADGSRKRGGQAKGIKARGSRRLGEDYHDYCRCRVVIVTPQNEVELGKQADEYYDAYATARDKVNAGYELNTITSRRPDGSDKVEVEWIDAKGDTTTAESRTSDITAYMRHTLGVS